VARACCNNLLVRTVGRASAIVARPTIDEFEL
jgi:hypothetical protein